MAGTTEQDLLNLGVDFLTSNGKIDATVNTDLKSYVSAIPYYKGFELLYSMFDTVKSTGVTFNAAQRIAVTANPFVLQTLPIALTNVVLFGTKICASVVDGISLKISEDGGTTFYNIPDISIFINLKAASFILQLTGTIVTNIERMYLLYI